MRSLFLNFETGSFYDYAQHKIQPETLVEEMPEILNRLVKLLVDKNGLPKEVVPDTAIINLYRPGDNIPPHVDHNDYPRPFSTLSLMSEAPMLFGVHMRPLGNGRWSAPFSTVLPRCSLLVLEGNGADLAKHCIPRVEERRISITLRKMPEWAAVRTKAARVKHSEKLRKYEKSP